MPNISRKITKMNGIKPTNVNIFGNILCAESVRSKKYEKHVEHNTAAGQYKNINIPSVINAAG